MSIDCGPCNSFRTRVERYYDSLLQRYKFALVECSADGDDRECVLMYESHRCHFLFIRSDGAEACTIGSLETPFPGNTVFLTRGEQGWYHAVALIEWQSRKKLLTARLTDEVQDGKRDYLEWESHLVNDWAERLFALFSPGSPRQWHDDFWRYARTRRYA